MTFNTHMCHPRWQQATSVISIGVNPLHLSSQVGHS